MKKTIMVVVMALALGWPGYGGAIEKGDQIKIFEQKIRGMLGRKILPIIDVEFHYGGRIEIKQLISRMDENGVALTWLGPNERLGSNESLRLNALYPDWFVPTTVHGDGPLWHGSDKGFLERLGRDARSGKYFAMGEFEGRHYPSGTNSRDIHMPVDSEAMQVVFALSSETGIPFLIHHEGEDALFPELERMLVKYPKATVIWCHIGRNRNPSTWKKFRKADGVRELIKAYPNLYFDLVQSKPGSKYHGTGLPDAILYEVSFMDTTLDPDWKRLLEEYPDRFVIGSDINTGRFESYARVIDTFRRMVFKNLRKDVAEKIAFKNAWRLMTGADWKD